MQHALDEAWSVDLPDDAAGGPDDDGNLVVAGELGTIVVSVFVADPGFAPEAALDALKAGDRPAPRAEFDEYGPDGTVRWAFLTDDDGEDVPPVQAAAARSAAVSGTGVLPGAAIGQDDGGVDDGGVDDGGDGTGMGLYGYVVADDGWVQVAVLFPDRHDHDRALAVWRSVRHAPPA